MAIRDTQDLKEKMIYQYKLLKRIRRHAALNGLYIVLLLSVLFAFVWLSGLPILLPGAVAWIGFQLLYSLLTVALLKREADPDVTTSPFLSRYKWLLRFPWFGYLPDSGVPFRQYRSIQRHLLFIGFAVAGAVVVWLPREAAVLVIYIHLWWMTPRLLTVLAMRKYARAGGIIAFSSNDVVLYEA